MRLGQLSRQLNVSASEIATLVASEFREISAHPNVKLSEEEASFVIRQLAPESIEAEEKELVEENTQVTLPELDEQDLASFYQAQQEAIEKEKEALSKLDADFLPDEAPKIELPDQPVEKESNKVLYEAVVKEEPEEPVELIKAPKIQLEGLKVLGKIELPEPKPKKEEASEEEAEEDKTDKGSRKPRQQRNRNRRKKPQLNPVERERRKQQKEEARKKKEAEKKRKEKKKAHYLKQVEQAQKHQPKKPNRKKAATINASDSANQSKPTVAATPPKKEGTLKRLWGWLNGKYDKF